MSYFPFYFDIEGMKALVIGGGHIACGKVDKLLPYGPKITVVAPVISSAMRAFNEEEERITILERGFEWSDIEGAGLVISATDNNELNHEISVYCKERKIPVNVVDRVADCSFIFPALVKKGMLSIGITTEGASPRASVYFKDRIQEIIPSNIEEILEFLYSIRPIVRDSISPESERANFYHMVFDKVMESGKAIPEDELQAMVEEYVKKLSSSADRIGENFNW